MNTQDRKTSILDLLRMAGVALVLLDALNAYLLKQIAGPSVPVNMILPVIVAVIAIWSGFKYIFPPLSYSIIIFFGIVGLLLGAFTIDQADSRQLYHIGSAGCAFILGYSAFRGTDNYKAYHRLFLAVGLMYTLVGVLAVRHVFPNVFPVINSYWAYKGTLQIRPEVMIDQNFQILYLIPVALALLSSGSVHTTIIAALSAVGALYFLVQLQTRSGVLVLTGLILIAAIMPFWYKELGRKKMLILAALGAIGATVFVESILNIASLLIIRFTDAAAATKSTGYGRLYSSLYAFEHLFDLDYWMPHGNADFRRSHGDVPHSNIAGMYLEGGILALIMWFYAFLFPLIKLSKRFLQRRIDKLACSVFLGAFGVMVVQLSLNVPLNPQVWLWAGASIGTLVRLDHKDYASRTTTSAALLGHSWDVSCPPQRVEL